MAYTFVRYFTGFVECSSKEIEENCDEDKREQFAQLFKNVMISMEKFPYV